MYITNAQQPSRQGWELKRVAHYIAEVRFRHACIAPNTHVGSSFLLFDKLYIISLSELFTDLPFAAFLLELIVAVQ